MRLRNRVMFYLDEFGTLPKIESAEMMFSASRSRRMSIVAIIQSFAQLDKNYGKEGGEIIVDNTQITIFGGFAPNSESAETLSKALGTKTVQSGSVSMGKDQPTQSLQMMERSLMTADELKSLPKGTFIVMKTGAYPMQVHLKLFFEWGISFDKEAYSIPDQGNRRVQYNTIPTLFQWPGGHIFMTYRSYFPENPHTTKGEVCLDGGPGAGSLWPVLNGKR